MVVGRAVVAAFFRTFLVKQCVLRFNFRLVPSVRGRPINLRARKYGLLWAAVNRELGTFLFFVSFRRCVVVRFRFDGHEIVGQGATLENTFPLPFCGFLSPLNREHFAAWVKCARVVCKRTVRDLVEFFSFRAGRDRVRSLCRIEGVGPNHFCVHLIFLAIPTLLSMAICVVEVHHFGFERGCANFSRYLR